jgi:uncharacterized protein YbaR (Trm112 family)
MQLLLSALCPLWHRQLAPPSLLSRGNLRKRYTASMISQELLEMIVCPVCKKALVVRENGESLKCGECKRVYPIRDNIPILLIDEAVVEP